MACDLNKLWVSGVLVDQGGTALPRMECHVVQNYCGQTATCTLSYADVTCNNAHCWKGRNITT